MLKKEYLFVFVIIGLSIAYAVLSLIVLLTRGKWVPAAHKKIAIGAAIVAFTAILNCGSIGFAQEVTPDPTSAPTPVYGTLSPTATPEPMVDYAAPTAEATIEPMPDYATPTTAPAPLYGVPLLGDVDSNNEVNIIDALLIAQFYVNMPVEDFNEAAADVNCSDRIDIIDALLVAQKYVGLLDELPGCDDT